MWNDPCSETPLVYKPHLRYPWFSSWRSPWWLSTRKRCLAIRRLQNEELWTPWAAVELATAAKRDERSERWQQSSFTANKRERRNSEQGRPKNHAPPFASFQRSSTNENVGFRPSRSFIRRLRFFVDCTHVGLFNRVVQLTSHLSKVFAWILKKQIIYEKIYQIEGNNIFEQRY